MPARYASDTSVSVDKSIAELRRIITRYGYGAGDIGIMIGETVGGVTFAIDGRRIKMAMKLPTREETMVDSIGRPMRFNKLRYEKAHRQMWRALVLVVKAKLEGIEAGIETFDEAFLPYLVMSNGKTMGEVVLNQIETGTLKLLGGGA